jgi:uncharacterized membrane protein YgcG
MSTRPHTSATPSGANSSASGAPVPLRFTDADGQEMVMHGVEQPPVEQPTEGSETKVVAGDGNKQDDKEDAMEGISYTRKVVVPLCVLNPEQRTAVLASDPANYPANIPVLGGHIRMDDFFDLRGADVPRDFPEQLKNHRRIECVLGFKGDEGSLFVGASLLNKVKASEQRKIAQAARGRGRGHGGGQGKAPAPNTPPAQPTKSKDHAKVTFWLDSQTPNIEIFAKKSGEGSEVVSTRIWARDLVMGSDGLVDMHFRPTTDRSLDGANFSVSALPGSNASATELEDLAAENMLVEISMRLIPLQDRRWGGMSDTEVTQALKSYDAQASKERNTVTRDLAVNAFSASTNLTLYIRIPAKEHGNWKRMFDYLRRLLSLGRHVGNYWFYRTQLHINNIDHNVIEKPELPKFDFAVPRWLVNSWEFTEKAENGQVSWMNPVPYKWNYLRVFDEYPNPDESAFLLKLGIEGEMKRQTRDLEELVQSRDKMFFRGLFLKADEKHRGVFIVQIFMGTEEADTSAFKMPGQGTKIVLRIDQYDPYSPSDKGSVEYKGSVVQDLFNQGASFVCVVRGDPRPFDKERLQVNVEYPISIGYTIETVTHDRQMLAVQAIQAIPSDNKPSGVDLKALFLGDQTPAPSRDAMSLATTAEKTKTFVQYMGKRARKLNDTQREAALDTTKSRTGLTTVQGPPGTGKSNLLDVLINGHIRMGNKVMAVAPQNEATLNMCETFAATAKREGVLDELEYVHFTGAYQPIERAERLRLRQELMSQHSDINEEDANVMIDSNNLMTEYARVASDSTGIMPEHEWTFGSRLSRFISRYAALEKDFEPQTKSYAVQYLDLKGKLDKGHSRHERNMLNEDLGKLEHILGTAYLQRTVKVVFCTLSTSAHLLLIEAYAFPILIIDEAAHESLDGLATTAGAFKHCIRHITLAGDHKQLKGASIAQDSNVGHAAIARCLFAEVANDPKKRHSTFVLEVCYRMLPNLLAFVAQFYQGVNLKADRSTNMIDVPLQNTMNAFWASYLRDSFQGDKNMVAIDVSGAAKHELLPGTTTKFNNKEAILIAETVKKMLEFTPPANTTTHGYRKIVPADFSIVTPYTGQVLEIRKEMRRAGIDTSRMLIATTNHSQSKQRLAVFFSVVVNTGSLRPGPTEKVPIHFVAQDHNINVSLSRQRLACHIVGGMRCLVQMAVDGHAVAHRDRKFFRHLRELADADNIVTTEEWNHVLEHNKKPPVDSPFAQAQAFKRQIEAKLSHGTNVPRLSSDANVGYNPNAASRPQVPPVVQTPFHGINTATSTAGLGTSSAPGAVRFGGKRDSEGGLEGSAKHAKQDGGRGGRGGGGGRGGRGGPRGRGRRGGGGDRGGRGGRGGNAGVVT